MDKKFIIEVDTNWCGENQEYAAIAKEECDLWDVAQMLAYDNFSDYGGFEEILNEEFGYKDEYSDEEIDYASDVEAEYYSYGITEVNSEDDLERFNDIFLYNKGLVYNSSNEVYTIEEYGE